MASSLAQVQIEVGPASFASNIDDCLYWVKSAYALQYRRVSTDLLKAIIHQIDKEITEARDAFWRLLFNRDNSANIHPPAPEEVGEIVARCHHAIQSIVLDDSDLETSIRLAIRDVVSRFVIPNAKCRIIGDGVRTQYASHNEYLRYGGIELVVHMFQFLELATRTNAGHIQLSRTLHPGLIANNRDFTIATPRLKELVRSTLLFKNIPPKLEAEYKEVTDQRSPNFYRHYKETEQLWFYLRHTSPGMPTEWKWKLAGHIAVPLIMGPGAELCLSLELLHMEMQYMMRSKIIDNKVIKYHPITEEPPSYSMAFPSEVMDKIFEECLKLGLHDQLCKTCKWTRRKHSLRLIFDPEAFWDIMVPGEVVVQFTLASLATIVINGYASTDDQRTAAVDKLNRFVGMYFPFVQHSLADALEVCINTNGENLPEHLLPHSGRLLRSEILNLMVSQLRYQGSQKSN